MTPEPNMWLVVAKRDGQPGCPERRNGAGPLRCGLGVTTCARHGAFDTKTIEVYGEITGGVDVA